MKYKSNWLNNMKGATDKEILTEIKAAYVELEDCEHIVAVFDRALSAREKQIPKKRKTKYSENLKYNVCPECCNLVVSAFKYCAFCGQALKQCRY